MKIKNIALGIAALSIGFTANAQQNGDNVTKNGLTYKFIKGNPKTEKSKNYGVVGDFSTINYTLKVGDSILYNSHVQNGQKPVKAILEEYNKSNIFKTGVPMEALFMMSKGDSAVYSTSAINYFSTAGLPMPDWINENDVFSWSIGIIDYLSYKDYLAGNAKIRKASNAFQKLPSGLEYQFFKLGKGGYAPKPGDIAQFHVNYYIGDSLIFNSRKLNENKPVPQQLSIPMLKSDLMEGLLAMQAGDSAQFRVKITDFATNTGTPMQDWMPKDGYHRWEIMMDDVKSQEAMKIEQEKKAKELLVQEEAAFLEYFKTNNIKDYKKTASGIYYIMLQEGTGEKVSKGKNVTVNYTGMLMSGKKFDSNVDPSFHHVDPFSFNAGTGSVIKGWDEGIMLLNKGAKAMLFIPSPLAYGERGAGQDIPANTPLIFEIEVLDFK